MISSDAILERFRLAHGKDIDLGLRAPYAHLLASLGHPELHLPPTLIVAGTNGKGSTCAFLRAIVEASGHRAHVYTSPHLVEFHERIRIAGNLISEEELADILSEAEDVAEPGGVSIFEATTAAALVAFARHPADVTILEVGLGGRLDATNIAPHPIASVITRLSFDHRQFLGNSMAQIAHEKAGIMRAQTPCFVAPQPSQEALDSLNNAAQNVGAPLILGGLDWRVEQTGATHFSFISEKRTIHDLPLPALTGAHQLWNAGLAIAALAAIPFHIPDDAVRKAMTTVQWHGRLETVTEGSLANLLPQDCELWLDGGHNDSAGEILAAQMKLWQQADDKPVDLIYAMLTSKVPQEFLTPLLPFVRRVRTLKVNGEVSGFEAAALADQVRALGIQDVSAASNVTQALCDLIQGNDSPARILVTGSLYLVGQAMKENGSESV